MTTAPPRRLYRSRRDRMLGGVAGGVAEYLQVDPVLTRLAFVALVLAAGAGFLLYIVAWVVIPEEPEQAPTAAGPDAPAAADAGSRSAPAVVAAQVPAKRPSPIAGGARLVAGTLLIAVGSILLLDRVIPDMRPFFWAGALIVFGLGLLVYGARR